MRSTKFTNVRKHFHNDASTDDDMDDEGINHNSRLFLGKNKLMQIALGRSEEEEHDLNLQQVSKHISGSVGILCTSKSIKEIEKYFSTLSEDDYARGGNTVTLTSPIIITNDNHLSLFQTTMVDQFRKLGLPVEVNMGKVCLVGREEFVLVKKGESVLSVETCKLLHLFEIRLAKFRLGLLCRWEKGGQIEEY